MLTITVARKPLDGTVARNALTWGTGGINIDATRILAGQQPTPTTAPGWDSLNARNALGGYRDSAYQQGPAMYNPSSLGRWPANLILSHLEGCQVVGTKKVKSGTAVRRHVGHSTAGLISYARGTRDAEMQTDMSYADAEGNETVQAWQCEAGCPVAGLDQQSGILRSAIAKEPKVSHVVGQFVQNARTIPGVNQHGDEGGASRFFKQVGKCS